MTSRLTTLRSQLTGLREARALVRNATAWSAAGIALLWALAAVFLLDWTFELDILPRIVVILLAAAGVAWAIWKFTRPMLGIVETDEDMALLVERQQQIDSDLVAALQFETPEAKTWGSQELEGAVIDYVAQVGGDIKVYEGFSREQIVRRASILGVTAAVLLLAAMIWSGHAAAFFNRLLLGSRHYPTDTVIQQIVVNRQSVLMHDVQGSRPDGVKCAEGRPVSFLIHCRGDLPSTGEAALVSRGATRSKTKIDLTPLTADERVARLQLALQKVKAAQQSSDIDISLPWRNEIATLVRFDAPNAARELEKVKERAELAGVTKELSAAIAAFPNTSLTTAIYAGELTRLLDNVNYKLFLGDAWTDAAAIAMIPLPIVEPRLTPVPPEYARAGKEVVDTGSRQLSVVEGSAVQVALACTNKKPLTAAWLNLKTAKGTQRYELDKQDAKGYEWSLAKDDSPLSRVTQELRYEIQVIDADGLSLETPLRGSIRIKPDRSPLGSAELVHQVVLPTAEPVVEYRASDDYGISALRLLLEIQRHEDAPPAAAPVENTSEGIVGPAPLVKAEVAKVELLAPGTILRADRLPLASRHALQLSPLKLAKGDRVKVTLETVDYRGQDAQGKILGESHQSEPLILEVSDESGVLAAISAADERSEQRLTDIIKRQLGIGESP
jgi:hypothetical protein